MRWGPPAPGRIAVRLLALAVLTTAPRTVSAQNSPLRIWAEDLGSGKKLRVQNVSNQTVRLVSYQVTQCVNVTMPGVMCGPRGDGTVLPPGSVIDLSVDLIPDDSSKRMTFRADIIRWESVASAPTSCPGGQRRCGVGCMPMDADCCKADGSFCRGGSYCGPANHAVVFMWDGTCPGRGTPTGAKPNPITSYVDASDDVIANPKPNVDSAKALRAQEAAAAQKREAQAAAEKKRDAEAAEKKRAVEAVAGKKRQAEAEVEKKREANVVAQQKREADLAAAAAEAEKQRQVAAQRQRAAEETQRQAEMARRQQGQRTALAAADVHERNAQAALASGQGNAINEQLQAQLHRIEAGAASRGQFQAASQISASAQYAANGQAVGAAVTNLGMTMFSIYQANEAREEAARQQKQDLIDAQHDRAEQMAETWHQLDGLVGQVTHGPDYPTYLHSAEHDNCRSAGVDSLDSAAIVRGLETSGDSDADVATQSKAMSADGRGRRAVQCLVESVDAWKSRIREVCVNLISIPHDALGADRAAHPDVPARCYEEAETAQLNAMAGSLKVGSAPGSGGGKIALKQVGTDATPLELKAVSAGPGSSLELKTLSAEPVAPTPNPGALSLKPIH